MKFLLVVVLLIFTGSCSVSSHQYYVSDNCSYQYMVIFVTLMDLLFILSACLFISAYKLMVGRT